MDKLKNYFLLEKIPKAPIFIFALADFEFVEPYFKNIHKLDVSPGPHLCIYEDQDFLFCYQLDELKKCTQVIFDKLISRPNWGIELDEMILENSKVFINYCQAIEKKDLSKLTNKELAEIFNDWWFKYFYDSWCAGWPAVLVDFEKNLFSNHLLSYLKNKTKGQAISVGDIFSALTTPLEDSFAQLETESLLRLLKKVQADDNLVELFKSGDSEKIIQAWEKINSELWQEFEQHYEHFCWLPFMYIGPAWDRKYFVDSLYRLLEQKTDPEVEFAKIKDKKQQIKKLHDEYIKDLEIHGDYQTLFAVARRFVFSKSYRKDAMYYGCYIIDKLLREISKRTFLSLKQIQRVYPWEMEAVILGKGIDVEMLNQRNYAVQYSSSTGRVTYEGQAAKDFVAEVEFAKMETETPRDIMGDTASVGKVRGTVKLINSPEDMQKMKEGNILVSYATSPDIMPAIRRASAIVTDLGGIICHAAIVSRELHIPCVVGTKIATQVLKDGDLIEVDATHGIIRLINNKIYEE